MVNYLTRFSMLLVRITTLFRRKINDGFKIMGDRMKDTRVVICMIKFAANKSRSMCVVERKRCKSLVVNKVMYGYVFSHVLKKNVITWRYCRER